MFIPMLVLCTKMICLQQSNAACSGSTESSLLLASYAAIPSKRLPMFIDAVRNAMANVKAKCLKKYYVVSLQSNCQCIA